MTLPVKYFHSAMQGAPQLTNDWGCITALLDACLVTGFNVKTISGITSAAGVATAVIDAGHLYEVGQVVTVSGVDQAAYNGEVRVLSTTANNITYAVSGSPASPATGASMSVKTAPLGWEIAYTATNKRAYRSLNVLSNKPILRVDDALDAAYTTTYAKKAKVTMAQGMSDIDTFVGARAPYDPVTPTKNEVGTGTGTTAYDGWYKWYYARLDGNSGSSHSETNVPETWSREWTLIGDDRGFYFFPQWANASSHGGRAGYCFTDFESYRSADGFNTLMVATDNYCYASQVTMGSGASGNSLMNKSLDFGGKVLMKDHTQVGPYVRAGFVALGTYNGQSISGYTTGVPWPNGPDYSLVLHPVLLKQENNNLRGKMPGMMWVHNDYPALSQRETITGVVGYAGRTFMIVKMAYQTDKESSCLAFDITGPWW